VKISELTEFVSLINPVTTTDDFGGVEVDSEGAAEVSFYCNIKSNRSGTYNSEGNTSELESWTCEMRKDEEIDIRLSKLILWRFQKYAITSVANVEEGKYRWVRFTITKLNV
jgi:hypothetical protein